MKLDAAICALVVALTLVVPTLAYVKGGENWLKESDEAASFARKYEQLAQDAELGRIKADPETFSTFLRMQAQGKKEHAAIFTGLGEADRKFLSAALGFAGVQASLLAWLLMRRRKAGRGA
jgi:hypothetical protein